VPMNKAFVDLMFICTICRAEQKRGFSVQEKKVKVMIRENLVLVDKNINATTYRAMLITVAESSRRLRFSAARTQDCYFETHSGCRSNCRPCYGPVIGQVFERSINSEV
jgi:hypothetical protein